MKVMKSGCKYKPFCLNSVLIKRREKKGYINIGELYCCKKLKNFQRQFEYSLVLRQIIKEFKGKNIVINAWKQDQFNSIGNNKFLILSKF